MQEITTVGLDLAKNVFHLIGCNAYGKEVKRKMLKRGQVMAYFANLLQRPLRGAPVRGTRSRGSVDCAAARQGLCAR